MLQCSPMNSSAILSKVGTLLIILSVIGMGIIIIPLLRIYLFPPSLTPPEKKGIFITIPKISAQAPIVLDVDPWNEAIYKSALTKGVAHAKGTARPGQNGTSFLFAHSSGMPWEITRYNTIFLRLSELTISDQIILTVDGKRFLYRVVDKKEVTPEKVEYLAGGQNNQLILQTCTPIGTSLNRLLVFASPVKK